MKEIQILALVRRVCIICAILLSTGLTARMAWAQELTGEIDGRVTDSSGAVVPNVTVTIRNEDQKNVARTVQTNAQGQFSVPLLPLARYSVSVSAPGFRPVETLVEVHTGITSTANVSLAPGAVTEEVNVTADSQIAPQLDSPAAGTLIPSTKVTELSLSSRNFVQLVAIQPGVSGGIPGGTQDRGSISSAGKVNSANYEVNGIAANYNGFFLDGRISSGAQRAARRLAPIRASTSFKRSIYRGARLARNMAGPVAPTSASPPNLAPIASMGHFTLSTEVKFSTPTITLIISRECRDR